MKAVTAVNWCIRVNLWRQSKYSLLSFVTFEFFFNIFVWPSVLWLCWLGGRKGIRPVKKLSGGVLVWLSVWSEVQTCIWPSWCHCHSLSLASGKSKSVLPFWYLLTRVVPDKGPLNVCVCVCVSIFAFRYLCLCLILMLIAQLVDCWVTSLIRLSLLSRVICIVFTLWRLFF